MSDPPVNKAHEHLVAAARREERDARRELFTMFRDVGYRVAFRITGNDADALDVVQDAFIRAFGSLDRLEDDGSFKTWLLRIVNNRALDLLRSRRVRTAISIDGDNEDGDGIGSILEDASAGTPEVSMDDLGGRVTAALDALPPDQRSVLALYMTGSMTYGEIAEVLGVPMGTVMSRIYRARRQMIEWLPEYAERLKKD